MSSCYMTLTLNPWPQAQVTNFSIDLLVTGVIYYQLKPNYSLQLLFTCSLVRWVLLAPMLLLSTSFDLNTPHIECNIVVYFAEAGWFINDQVSLLSTFQRAVCYSSLAREQIFLRIITYSSLIIGLVLRIFRNPCRFEYPDGTTSCWIGSRQLWDNLIVINVIFFELLLLVFILLKLRQFSIDNIDPTGMFKKTKKETLIRVCVLIPLGICESFAYIVQQTPNAPLWINWILTIAIYCRQFSPLIISVVIVLGKLPDIKKSSYSKLSDTPSGKSSSLQKSVIKKEDKNTKAIKEERKPILLEDTIDYSVPDKQNK